MYSKNLNTNPLFGTCQPRFQECCLLVIGGLYPRHSFLIKLGSALLDVSSTLLPNLQFRSYLSTFSLPVSLYHLLRQKLDIIMHNTLRLAQHISNEIQLHTN